MDLQLSHQERFSVLFCPRFFAAAINLSHLFLETLSFLWYDFFVFTNPKTGEKCACLVDGAAKHIYRYVALLFRFRFRCLWPTWEQFVYNHLNHTSSPNFFLGGGVPRTKMKKFSEICRLRQAFFRCGGTENH